MIKIEKLSDVHLLNNTNPLLRDYIMHLIGYFTQQYSCNDISEFGAFYILESQDDVNDHKAYGLSSPIEETVFEFADMVTIKSGDDTHRFISTLALLNNDYGVNLFVAPELLTSKQLANLLSEYTEVEVKVDINKQLHS